MKSPFAKTLLMGGRRLLFGDGSHRKPPPELVSPPRWPWVLLGLFFFPVLAFIIERLARAARHLMQLIDAFGNHPALAGLLVWIAAAIVVGGSAILVRRYAPRPSGPPSLPPADPTPSVVDPQFARWGAIAEGLVYGLVAFVILLPASADPLHRLAGAGDPWNMVWLNWRLADLIKGGNLFPYHIADAIFPIGLDLRVSDSYVPVAIGTAWALVAPPILAYNLALATGVVFNMLAARRLARLFITDRIPVIIVSLAYATAPALALRTFGHFTLAIAFVAPLVIAEAVEIARGDRPVRPVRVALLLFLAYLSGIYWLISGGIALGVVVLVTQDTMRARAKKAGRLVIAGLLTLVLMSPLVVQRLRLDRAEAAAGANPVLTSEAFYYSGDAFSVFAQPVSSTIDAPWNGPLRDAFIPNTLEATVFPGYLLLIGLAALLFTRSRLRIPLVSSAVVLWLLTLGPGFSVDGEATLGQVGWLPYQLLLSIPGLGSLRAPNRFSFTLAAILTAALALVVAAWWRGWSPRRRLVAAAIGVALLAVNLQIPINNSSDPVQEDETALLTRVADLAQPGDTVMIVPGDCFGRVGVTSTWQIDHGLPFVGCQGNTASLPLFSGMESYVTQAISAFRCQPEAFARRTGLSHSRRLQVLPDHVKEVSTSFGVRFLLVDKDMVAGDATCIDRDKSASIESLAAWYEVVGETEQLMVVDITRGPLAGDTGLAATASAVYEIMLGRTPSDAEATAAVAAIAESGRNSLRDQIRASEEFAAVNCDERPEVGLAAAAINDATFVGLVYDTMLLRAPDKIGYTNSVDYLATAEVNRDPYVRSIIRSDEFRRGACGAT